MKSIPAAITWEILQKGRLNLIAGFLLANLLPALLFSAFRKSGVDFRDPSLIMIHSTLILTNMCICAVAIFSVQGPPSRLYCYPVPASILVACHLIPTMLIACVEMLLSTAFLNSAFDLHWPLWSPALFAAVTIGLIQATMWFTEKSAWLPWAIVLIGGPIAVWYHFWFSSRLFEPSQNWIAAIPVEAVLLSVTAVVAFFVGANAMARNRCGEQLKPTGIGAWIYRMLDFVPRDRPPFRTGADAQTWFEWKLKGWAMPVTVVFGLAIGLTVWVIFNRDPKVLVGGLMAGGGILSAAAMVWALVVGNVGPIDANFEMGHFLASRPMTSKDMARTILKMTSQSVLLAWAIWAGAFLIVAGILFATGFAPQPFIPDEFSWWFFPLTLLGSWIMVSVFASFGLTGRTTMCAQLFLAILALYFGSICFYHFALSANAQKWFLDSVTAICGGVFFLGTAWLFAAASQRKLIEPSWIFGSLCVWAALSAVAVTIWVRHPTGPFEVCILFSGLAALVVAPLAAAPLALAWNRTR